MEKQNGHELTIVILDSFRDLPVAEFLAVYAGSLRPDEKKTERNALYNRAEGSFLDYLQSVFFLRRGARCILLKDGKEFVSALRIEPWKDGFLVEGLETRPDCRKKGYASRLLLLTASELRQTLYSHVYLRNRASMAVHRACGFSAFCEYAQLLDGTVSTAACTMIREWEENAADFRIES